MVVGTVRDARRVIAGAVLAAAVVLGGCAQSPSNVAVVDGTPISAERYETAVAAMRQVDPQVRPDVVLTVLVQGEIAARVADEQGITITEGDRRRATPTELTGRPELAAIAGDVADVRFVAGTVGEEQLVQRLAAADVQVNPRFGRWDGQQLLRVVPSDGSLAQPAEDRPEE